MVYNLVLAMMWQHPENVDLDRVKVVHYCAAVSFSVHSEFVHSIYGKICPSKRGYG